MNSHVSRVVNDLGPGDQIDIDQFELDHGSSAKRQLLDEIEGRGFVIDSRGRVGEVSYCAKCDGSGDDCRTCDGYGMTIDNGRGLKPFKD